jgi:hypothetical protein|mmetsp:Transcript_47133/g.74468  ORF Transcript_47133/g.74468 Transcript_47133/m.74468 type:complete len:170 (-) Transcript_47133:384-893(-)
MQHSDFEILTHSEELTSQSSSDADSIDFYRSPSSLDVGKHQVSVELDTSKFREALKMREAEQFEQQVQDLIGKGVRVSVKSGGVMSEGSALHWQGLCTPCSFFSQSNGGCRQGLNCDFCHLFHTRSTNSRPGKHRRERHRKIIDHVMQGKTFDEAMDEVSQREQVLVDL